jgi:hypothetical protein
MKIYFLKTLSNKNYRQNFFKTLKKWQKQPVDKSVDKCHFPVDKSVDKMWITFDLQSYPQVFEVIHRISTGLSTGKTALRCLIKKEKPKVIHRKGLPLLLLSLKYIKDICYRQTESER